MGAVACDNYQLHVRGTAFWICEMDEALVGLSSSSDEAGASKVESTVAVASAVEGVARGVSTNARSNMHATRLTVTCNRAQVS